MVLGISLWSAVDRWQMIQVDLAGSGYQAALDGLG
jgi:hypothetical protein